MSFIARTLIGRSRPAFSRCVICSNISSARPSARSYSAKMPESDVAPVRKVKHSQSIMPSGTVMKDLSILKDKPDPIAMPDDEYPSWLWTLTDEALAESQHGKKAAELDAEGGLAVGDASGKVGLKGQGFDRQAERRKLRSSNKAEIKARNFLRTT